jgi:Tol biopolymer transport system component/DNA-binding winged helix-turn-helix (wHTH) protein
MPNQVGTSQTIRFATFEVDLQTQELRKRGVRLRLPGQSFQVLKMLLERPGALVTREEFQHALWPSDTFVDFDHGLSAAVNRLREALGDSADNPEFIETLPRRGYRFIAPIKERDEVTGGRCAVESMAGVPGEPRVRSRILRYVVMAVVLSTAAGSAFLIYKRPLPGSPKPRALSRLTFGTGLQMEPTWSPDGRYIAYTADGGGKLEVWVQQVSGGDPVQITHSAGNNWQPSWSPDGKFIAYRSEGPQSGLYIVPALGGKGLERRIASFGYKPRWSPDAAQILFQTVIGSTSVQNSFYVVELDGSQPRRVLAEFPEGPNSHIGSVMWHPDGKRLALWVYANALADTGLTFWTVPVDGGPAMAWELPAKLAKQLDEISDDSGPGYDPDFSFSWAPSGKAVYFARTDKGVKNIWKMSIQPETLRATALERLTTGVGSDCEPAVSPDGGRLAFSAKSRLVQIWMFPFDERTGRISGKGWVETSSGMQAVVPSLSPDGTKLAYSVFRRGRDEIWTKSLLDAQESPLIVDDYSREFPQWSQDGKRLVYRRGRVRSGTVEKQLVVWSEEARSEQPLTEWSSESGSAPYDWSADGKYVFASWWKGRGRVEVWQFSVDADSGAEASGSENCL